LSEIGILLAAESGQRVQMMLGESWAIPASLGISIMLSDCVSQCDEMFLSHLTTTFLLGVLGEYQSLLRTKGEGLRGGL
jgi:hypothetical protein